MLNGVVPRRFAVVETTALQTRWFCFVEDIVILKIDLTTEQLHLLHVALEQGWNLFTDYGGTGEGGKEYPFVRIVRSSTGDKASHPLVYNVTLSVVENRPIKPVVGGGLTTEKERSPLSCVTGIFDAVGLFPDDPEPERESEE